MFETDEDGPRSCRRTNLQAALEAQGRGAAAGAGAQLPQPDATPWSDHPRRPPGRGAAGGGRAALLGFDRRSPASSARAAALSGGAAGRLRLERRCYSTRLAEPCGPGRHRRASRRARRSPRVLHGAARSARTASPPVACPRLVSAARRRAVGTTRGRPCTPSSPPDGVPSRCSGWGCGSRSPRRRPTAPGDQPPADLESGPTACCSTPPRPALRSRSLPRGAARTPAPVAVPGVRATQPPPVPTARADGPVCRPRHLVEFGTPSAMQDWALVEDLAPGPGASTALDPSCGEVRFGNLDRQTRPRSGARGTAPPAGRRSRRPAPVRRQRSRRQRAALAGSPSSARPAGAFPPASPL